MNSFDRTPHPFHPEPAKSEKPAVDAPVTDADYVRSVNNLLQSLKLDEATTNRVFSLLSHPWVETEVLALISGKNSSKNELMRTLMNVAENIDVVSAQLVDRDKTFAQLQAERANWIEQEVAFSKSNSQTEEHARWIQKNIEHIDQQLKELPQGLLDVFREIPGTSFSPTEIRKAKISSLSDDEVEIHSFDTDTAPITPTHQILAMNGLRPPEQMDTRRLDRRTTATKQIETTPPAMESQTVFVDPRDLDME